MSALLRLPGAPAGCWCSARAVTLGRSVRNWCASGSAKPSSGCIVAMKLGASRGTGTEVIIVACSRGTRRATRMRQGWAEGWPSAAVWVVKRSDANGMRSTAV